MRKKNLIATDRASLWTKANSYRNVNCRVELKLSEDAYGCLGVRHSAPGGALAGITFCSLDSKRKTGSVFQNDAIGKSQIVVASPLDVKPDTWIVGEVIIRGSEMVVLIDGKETARHSLVGLPAEGGVGLTMTRGRFEVRKLEFKELPADMDSGLYVWQLPTRAWPKPQRPIEKPDRMPLFNGKDLSGWEADAPAIGKVQDGVPAKALPAGRLRVYVNPGSRVAFRHTRIKELPFTSDAPAR